MMNEPNIEKPQDYIDLVEYQDGSVVSRTLVKKDVGTATLFAFAKEQGLSEHSAPYDALVFVLEGTAEIKIGGVPQDVLGGQVLKLPANIPHALHAKEPFKMLLVMIRG